MPTEGSFKEGIVPHEWVADQFLEWWRSEVESALSEVEGSIACTKKALQEIGGWSNSRLDEAMHELAHAEEALAALTSALCFDEECGANGIADADD